MAEVDDAVVVADDLDVINVARVAERKELAHRARLECIDDPLPPPWNSFREQGQDQSKQLADEQPGKNLAGCCRHRCPWMRRPMLNEQGTPRFVRAQKCISPNLTTNGTALGSGKSRLLRVCPTRTGRLHCFKPFGFDRREKLRCVDEA